MLSSRHQLTAGVLVGRAFVLLAVLSVVLHACGHQYFPFLAVLAEALNALAVGAPLAPGFFIFSPEPALMRSRLAWMLL